MLKGGVEIQSLANYGATGRLAGQPAAAESGTSSDKSKKRQRRVLSRREPLLFGPAERRRFFVRPNRSRGDSLHQVLVLLILGTRKTVVF